VPAMRSEPSEVSMGYLIRRARRAAGMSQTDVERESGIPKARLSRYENNHVLPSLRSLGAICAAIGVRPGELVDASSDEPFRSSLSDIYEYAHVGPWLSAHPRQEVLPIARDRWGGRGSRPSSTEKPGHMPSSTPSSCPS